MDKLDQGIFPRRISDLWTVNQSAEIEVLSDSALYLNHYRLNPTARFIWELCDGTRNAREIALKLHYEYGGSSPPFEGVLADVLSVLNSLRESQLVDWDPTECVDVLLVAPPFPTTYERSAIKAPEYSAPPLGLMYIAEVLRQDGFAVAIEDLHLKAALPEEVVASCRIYRPRVVGVTATTPTYPNALRIARHVKAWNPDILVVLGGVHGSALPEDAIHTGNFDFVVIGEGEMTMRELMQSLSKGDLRIDDVPGLAFRRNKDDIVFTPPRSILLQVDDLPLPARDLVNLRKYIKSGSVSMSRGCPMGCKFCSCNLVFGKIYRARSINKVINEIEMIKTKYRISEIDFNDDTFNWQPERVFDLCRAIRDRRLMIRWSCFCRAAQMNQEMARVMREAGCEAVQFGVESGAPEILSKMGKETTIQEIEKAVRATARAGIKEVVCGVILGHPQDTPQTIRQTLEFADHLMDCGASRIMLSLLTPYPGTVAYRQAEDLGLKILTKDWEQFIFSRVIVETTNLTRDMLRELYVEGLIHFLDRRKTRTSSLFRSDHPTTGN